MNIDHDRIQAILNAEHSFYGSGEAPVRNDARLNPGTGDFLGTQFTSSMQVLDAGCGSGTTLLEYNQRFQHGLGIDNDPAHIQLAKNAQQARVATNVEFRLLDFINEANQLEPESFDFIFSQRGPIGDTEHSIQLALRVLRPNGLIFCEEIGDLHHQEVHQVFGHAPRNNAMIHTSDQLTDAMQRHGISVRLVSNSVSKRYYPDIYAWLQFQSAIWGWLGMRMPAADDPRFEEFVARNTRASGEIETTHHVFWVAGVKMI